MSNIEEQTVQLYSNVTGPKEPRNESGQGRSKSIQKFHDSVPAQSTMLFLPRWPSGPVLPRGTRCSSPLPSCHPGMVTPHGKAYESSSGYLP
jgi:hypothetical protein